MLSWRESKGEQAVVLFRFAFTMSPVPFLPFNVLYFPFRARTPSALMRWTATSTRFNLRVRFALA